MRFRVVLLVCVLQALMLLPTCCMANLAIDEVLDALSPKSPPSVCELPADDKRAEAISYVQKQTELLGSGREIVDSSKVDDSVLKQKLAGGFVLFTTLDEKSKLFRLATQPLGLQIDGDTLQWRDLSVPVTGDLRLVMVGRNPYGAGYCVIFAAGSNGALVGMDSIFRWGSWDLLRGQELLRKGLYNQRFATVEDRISEDKAVADIKQFFSTVQRVHPDLLARVSIGDYVRLKQQTLEGITSKVGKDGKISVSDFAYLVYYAAAFFKDGHTGAWWNNGGPDEATMPVKRFPPFLTVYNNGRFVVQVSSDRSIEGMEILSVNGKPIMEFLRPALDRTFGETLACRTAMFPRDPYRYCYIDLCNSAPSLALRLRDVQGKERTQTIATVGFGEFWQLIYGGRFGSPAAQSSQVRFLDSDRVAYFLYPAFRESDEERKRIDAVFRTIKAKGAKDLIIDIRGNSGGSTSIGDFIFSYLYSAKLRQFSKARVKLSRDVLSDPETARMNGLPAVDDLDGVVMTVPVEERRLPKPSAFFTGRVYLLIDSATFSSATSFAVTFRDYRMGKILGYETGGCPICFGNLYRFELENSGIDCRVSFKEFFNAKPRPDDAEHGVLPDVPVGGDVLRTYQKEQDPVLAFTLNYVRKSRQGR